MDSKNIRLIHFAFWLIRLRWIGVIGIVVITFFSSRVMNISVREFNLYSISVVFLLLNIVYLILLKQILNKKSDNSIRIVKRLIIIQISTDLLVLTIMLHYSGGVENPFIIYYIFHMIIAGIILSPVESFLQTTFALLLIGLLTISEYSGIIPHHSLEGFVSHDLYKSEIYLIATGFIFITTSYLVVYITNFIVAQSRKHEKAYLKANIELEKKDAIKNEYVLRLTHDIKGHLAAIQSCLNVVNSKITGSLEKKQEEFVNRALIRTNVLIKFVKDLLHLTKMKLDDKFETDYFSIRKSIYKVITNIRADTKEKSINIKSEIDKSVDKILGFQISIEELISNLLLNAIKYSKDNSEIYLKVKDFKNNILVEIIDNGIGIPENEQEFIFNEFFRASNVKTTTANGTGMGLSIAKQIVQNHGGKIWVESKEGIGSKFSFTLPKIIVNDLSNP